MPSSKEFYIFTQNGDQNRNYPCNILHFLKGFKKRIEDLSGGIR